MIGVKTDILFVGKEMRPLVEVSSQLDGATYAIAIAFGGPCDSTAEADGPNLAGLSLIRREAPCAIGP